VGIIASMKDECVTLNNNAWDLESGPGKAPLHSTPYKQSRKSRQAVQQQHRKGSHGSRNQTDESIGESELSRKQLSKSPTRFVLGV
jgi:hypothetical protein